MITIHKRDLVRAAIIGEVSLLLLVLTTLFTTGTGLNEVSLNLYVAFFALIFAFPALSILSLLFADYIKRYISSSLQIMKFALVGALNTLVDIGVFTILVALFGATSYIFVTSIKVVSFFAAVTNSYIWNKFWVFGGLGNGITKKKDIKEMFSFLSVSIGGLVANIIAFSFFLLILGTIEVLPTNIVGLLSATGASLSSLLWNFVGYKLFVFKK